MASASQASFGLEAMGWLDRFFLIVSHESVASPGTAAAAAAAAAAAVADALAVAVSRSSSRSRTRSGASRSQRLELGARGWMDQVACAGEIDMQGGL